MDIDRRHFLGTVGAGLAALHLPALTGCATSTITTGRGAAGVGICDWNLPEGMCNPDKIAVARDADLEGIQVSVGSGPDNMPFREPDFLRNYIDLGAQHGITFHSVAIGILNSYLLATEPQSR